MRYKYIQNSTEIKIHTDKQRKLELNLLMSPHLNSYFLDMENESQTMGGEQSKELVGWGSDNWREVQKRNVTENEGL